MKLVAITGTADPFPRLVSTVAQYAAEHPEVQAWIQYGKAAAPPEPALGVAFAPRQAVLERMRQADVLVCHAGSGTILDAHACGHVPVLIPRRQHLGEHVDDHQLDVATAMGDAGRALVATAESLPEAIARAQALRGSVQRADTERFVTAVVEAVEAQQQRRTPLTRLAHGAAAILAAVVPTRRIGSATAVSRGRGL